MQRLLLAATAAVCLFGVSHAAVIDFEDLGVAVGTQLNPALNVSQNTGGFTMSSPGADLHFHNQDGFGDNGTTNMGAHGLVTATPVGGGTFSLTSFDFDYFIADLGSITITGDKSVGIDVVQVFVTDGFAAPLGGVASYETFLLAGFTDLIGVTFASGAANVIETNGFFIDNIVFSTPEPATIGLLGFGLALVGVLRRRAGRR